MSDNNVVKYRVVTTEAIRKAKNSEEVLEKIKESTGLNVDVLTHDDEARIYYHFVAKDFNNDRIAVVDIGGGSVQVVIGEGPKLLATHLLKTGSYFLQESEVSGLYAHEKGSGKSKENYHEAMRSMVGKDYGTKTLIYGSTNIIDLFEALKIPLAKSGYNGDHQQSAKIADVDKAYDRIVQHNYKDRMSMFPAEPYYMWSADKAFLNIFEIASILGHDSVVPSNANISSGILFELAESL